MLLLQRVRSAEEPRGPVFRQRNARDDMSRSGLSNWYPYLAVPLTIITDSACMTSMTWVSNAVPKFEQDPTPSAERLLSDPATSTVPPRGTCPMLTVAMEELAIISMH